MQGDRAAVQSLLNQKADVNGAQGDGNTALHWAAYRDDVEMAQMLIKAGADVKAKTRIGEYTPLFMAAKNGNAAMIDALLKAGAQATVASTTGTTPLMLASASGKADAVKLLLDAGANVNAKDTTNGQTALMFAASLNRGEVVKLLASRGADLNIMSNVSKILGRGGRDNDDQRRQDVTAMGGNAALHFAAREGAFDAVRALVEAGADVNAVTGSDQTPPITQAIIIGHFDIAMYLLSKGANPNLATGGGIAPLYATIDAKYAQRTWYPPPLGIMEQEKTTYMELMKALIDKGADVNYRLGKKPWFRTFGNSGGPDPAGATAFWRAAQANDIEAMKLLRAHGADPKIATTKNSTALQVAAGMRHSNQGANMFPENRLQTVKYLVEECGVDVNEKDSEGYTALHGSALVGRNDVMSYLVEKGGDITARANTISGSGDGGGSAKQAEPGKGDTVADLANGWSMNSTQYPETVTHAISLGSEFSNTCFASTCVNPTQPDRQTGARRR
jgi:ankyrin repeat protein